MPLKLMNIKVLWCDELRIQLVTWGFFGDFLEVKADSFGELE